MIELPRLEERALKIDAAPMFLNRDERALRMLALWDLADFWDIISL